MYVMADGNIIGPMFVWLDTMDWHEFRDGIGCYGYDQFGYALSGRRQFDIVDEWRPIGTLLGRHHHDF
jgi:hypothetical protein